MKETVVVRLAAGARLNAAAPGTVEWVSHQHTIRLKQLDVGVQAALGRLEAGPASIGELEKIAAAAHPDADLGRLALELTRMAGRSLLTLSCVVSGEELLQASAHGPLASFGFGPLPLEVPVQLTRFAYARRDGGTLIIEVPGHASVRVTAPALGALFGLLARPRSVAGLAALVPGCGAAAVHAAAAFLLGTGVLAVAGTEPGPALQEFHDVVMHASCRRGLTSRPLGGTYRLRGAVPPLQAVRPLPDGERFPLPRPDLDRLVSADPPLAQVMESRRSIREQGATPLTVAQLGEFLFRVARVKSVRGIDEAAGLPHQTSRRTAPAGGACHDLEFYLTVRSCDGLAPGMYHYDPAGHQLTLVCARPGVLRRMLADACSALEGDPPPPQVLITLASRFARLSWKYEGIAYALTLKNAGVLLEAMYLAATAMGLAPCALGCGDSQVFSEATGLDPLAESSVGEFILGSRVQE